MAKAKKLTLRQRLRQSAETKLGEIVVEMNQAASRVIDQAGSGINREDLMKLCSLPETRTLTIRAKLVTDLANEAEAELEALYNKQQGLPLGDDDAK